jgi:ATP synthase protein I
MQSAEDGVEEESFKRLSAEDVKALRLHSRQTSPWWVVSLQVFVGLLVVAIVEFVVGSRAATWSAAVGVLAVVVPSVVFVRGLLRQQWTSGAGSALGGFFLWEAVKVLLTVMILLAAPRLIENLNWLALLAGFVVTMKAYWLAVWLQSVRQKSVLNI